MPTTAALDAQQLDPVCSLDDPTRRRLYGYVAARGGPVTRDEASEQLRLERSTVAYHLDKLVDEGLLTASFARPAGRAGPGAGRPAKRYERSHREFAVNLPPRNYRLAAEVLARAAESDTTGAVRQALQRAAGDVGRELATPDNAASQTFLDRLADLGFEPSADGEVIRLRNCPFHRLAQDHTELICGMNLAMLTEAVDAWDAAFAARLDPAEGRCCVVLVPIGSASPAA